MNRNDDLQQRARKLALWGLLAEWNVFAPADWIEKLLEAEESERARRSLERRLKRSKLGKFKPIADFDWNWPSNIDRDLVEDVFRLTFLRDQANVVLLGPNGVGKTTIATNIAHQALLQGHTVMRTTASAMLGDLAAQETSAGLRRALRRYTTPSLLVLDELGYLSYDTHHADLLFEVVSQRYESKPIIITTNRPFGEWNEVFPNATCVTALVDRLTHRAELITIEGESYRAKEAKERAAARKRTRKTKRAAKEPKEAKE